MKRTMGGAALLAAVLAIAPTQAQAQMGQRGQRAAAAGPRGAGVEMILRQKERLELTDAQVKQLDQIRQDAVQRRVAHQAEMAELQSRVRAGQLEAPALRERMQARRDSAARIQEQQRERVEAVLNDAQKQKLEQWAGQARAFQMGRRSMMRGGRGVGPGAWGGPALHGGPGAWGGFMGLQRGFRRGGIVPGLGMQGMPGPMGRGRMVPGRGMGMGFGPPPDTIR
jgi:Spy/CpxP family protein refolding chaperone